MASVPDMNEKDAEKAIDIAYKSFHIWRETTAKVCIYLILVLHCFRFVDLHVYISCILRE